MKMFRIADTAGTIVYRARKRGALAEARRISRAEAGPISVYQLELHDAALMIAVENALNGKAINNEVQPILLGTFEKGFTVGEPADDNEEEEIEA